MLDDGHTMNNDPGEDFLCREATRTLFGQPDVLLVSEYLQVYQSSTAHTPEVRLIAAVLEDAIDCYVKNLGAKTRRGKRICNEAAEWIFGQNEDWIFGFENICEMLKLEPNYIRRILLHYKHLQSNDLPAQTTPQALRLAS